MKKYKKLKKVGAIFTAVALTLPVFQASYVYAKEDYTQMKEVETTGAQNDSELSKQFGDSIPQEYYQSLIVGDSSIVDLQNYECEILQGEDKVEIGSDNRVLFTKPGNVQIKLTNRSVAEDTFTYDFVVAEGTPEQVLYYPGHTLKIGDHINVGQVDKYVTSIVEFSQERFGYYYKLSYETRSTFTKHFIAADFVTPFPPGKPLGDRQSTSNMPAIAAYRPGTFTLTSRKSETIYEMDYTDDGELIGGTHDIVIEEPWIDTNLPQQIEVGNKLKVTTSLENTALTDMKVKDVVNDWDVTPEDYQLGYQPRIEIVEGEDLIKRSNGDYSNILTSSEDIEFVKEGTVTFKIIYDMLDISEYYWIKDEYTPYDPEKTVTVNVVSKPDVPENPENPSSELPSDTVEKVVDMISGTKEGTSPVVVDMGNVTIVPKAILESAKGKNVDVQLNMDGYTWTINGKDISASDLNDINLEVKFDTNAVPNSLVKELAGDNPVKQLSLTHNGEFGFKATLTMNAGKEYGSKYGNLYYYNNKNLEFMTSGKIAENGSVNLVFTHASDYVLVMSDTDMGKQETQNNPSGTKSVKTGDETSALPYVMILFACLGVGGIIIKRRHFAK